MQFATFRFKIIHLQQSAINLYSDKLNCVTPAAAADSSVITLAQSDRKCEQDACEPPAFTENEAPMPPTRDNIQIDFVCSAIPEGRAYYSARRRPGTILMRRRVRHPPKYCPVMQTRHPSLRDAARSVFRFNFLLRLNIRRKINQYPAGECVFGKKLIRRRRTRASFAVAECHRRAQS